MAAAASIANLLNPNANLGQQTPQTPTTTATTADSLAAFNQAIPGFSGLTGQASSVIGNLLNGTPSPSTIRNAAATFGNANGLGTGSGIVNNYGYNLYNQQGQANQQQGVTDLLSMLGGYAGTVTPTAGQNLQNSQFNANLAQNANQFNQSQAQQAGQFDQSNALAQFNAMVNALGLGSSIVGQGIQQLPQLTL